MNRKFLMIILIIFLIIGGGSYCLYNWNSQEKKDTYTLGKVSRSDIGMIVDATGTIKPVNSVKLSATASGTLEHVYVKQNETVTKGQILATIESKSLTSTMEQAKNTLENKRSYYNRLNSLYEQGAVAYQTMDDARLSYLNARAAYTKAQADVNDTVITSPLDGVIIGEPMQEGETVSQGLSSQMVIVTVADLSAMKIELFKVYVKTGITTDKEVEIISGLNENDQIVVSGTVSQETSSTRVAKSQHGGPGF